MISSRRMFLGAFLCSLFCLSAAHGANDSKSKLPEEPIPIQPVPGRPKPLVELGEPFLGTGTLAEGFTIPTGATWQPSFLVWGRLRSAVFAIEDREQDDTAEWGNRLDVFAQLSLTYTERFVVSFRPLDESDEFTGYVFSPDGAGEGRAQFDSTVNTLYFEGDVAELFPGLDRTDSKRLDLGFSVGRQPLVIQDGMFVGGSIDSVGVVRNTLYLPGFANFRATGVYGWGNLSRGENNVVDPSARLFGVFTEGDTPKRTLNVDFAYVMSDSIGGDGWFAAVSSVQRLGTLNSTFRGLFSRASGDEAVFVGDGALVISELSITPRRTHDIAYLNAYGAFGSYTPVARGARAGGPLARIGILFEGAGIGAYGSALSNRSEDVWGVASGYQRFFNETRGQIVFELASRAESGSGGRFEGGFGTRFQHAVGRRLVFRLEGFAVGAESRKPRYGARSEIMLAF